MTTTKEEVKEKTKIVWVGNQAIAEKLLGAEKTKQEIAQQAKVCKELKITDDTSLQIATQQLTTLNKMKKAVEAKGKELRTPFTQATKFIKGVEDQIIGLADEVITQGKNAIQAYHNSKIVIQEATIEEVKEEAEEAMIIAEMSAEKKFAAIDCIRKWWLESFEKMNGAKDLTELKDRYLIHSWNKETKFPMAQFYDLPEAANELKRRIIYLKDLLKGVVDLRIAFKAETDEEKQLELSDQVNGHQRTVISFKKESKKYFDDMHATIAEEKEATENNANAEVVAVQVAVATDKTPGFEYTHELVDFSKVPDTLKELNLQAVKKYIKDNESKLANGVVIDGIRFIRTVKQIVLR